MRNSVIIFSSCLLMLCLAACSKKAETLNIPNIVKGDTADHVSEVLGDPMIEFPQDDWVVRMYEGLHITFSNNVVISVYQHSQEPHIKNEWSSFVEKHLRATHKADEK